MTCTIPIMPRVRRPRRQAPVLELLAATLPELRRGLTESAARTRRLRAVREARLRRRRGHRHASEVLAFVGAGADHHAAGDQPIRPVYEALAQDRPLLAPLGDPRRVRPPRVPARRRRRRAAAAHRRPGRRGRRLRDRRLAARRDGRRDARAARRPALGAAPALRAAHRDDDRAAGADGAALRLQRAQHDRLVHPHRARARAPARARVRRPPAQPARAPRRVRHARRGAAARAAATSTSSRRASARSSR